MTAVEETAVDGTGAQAVAGTTGAAPANEVPGAVPGVEGGELPEPGRASLSPSRAADFKTCPLLYRFRCIDRLPERQTADQARGTLVHAVLERLFDLPPAERVRDTAIAML